MAKILGIDTSNYTTSVAVYDTETKEIVQKKMLLPVGKGKAGLRQSDAVFHHTKQLPIVFAQLCDEVGLKDISAVGVSVRPRNADGSYMPCFLCGEGLADNIGRLLGVPVYKTSHQTGHILAALYSADKLDMVNGEFIAFHVSGGTTDCLYCVPDKESIIDITEVGSSLDLKAGQLIDRTGLMLGLDFPCGKELEKLALGCEKKAKTRPVMKDGSCCLSGFENKFSDMKKNGEEASYIARMCETAVAVSVYSMTEYALGNRGQLPVIYAGGVMSNRFIQGYMSERIGASYFAEPQYSCDNASGTAIYAALKGNF